ncbi:MAG: Holliday junction resolvase RuvX [Acidobacteria bacterium]|nr:Holliday junction resolvase RuvX [Acidobacteriota bacterium]MBU4307504.1 Holliday junction resolvase RuvX [Acidobacteriota bacterium]MBU4405662.1 Holliday junction resolvase RuvX [Acidobacteriota bacterium]MCG2810887.1 Holliday junction resolvase RuvX [Candidatus Aminicenantes bacterium]
MKVLAVDYGSKRIGLAVGNSMTRVATPLGLIATGNIQEALVQILKRVGEFEVGHIVVGYPLHADGSRSRTCGQVDRFVNFLRKRIDVPVTLVDEKLSSVAAEEMSKDIPSDFRTRKTFLDALAAQVILQNYFEHS